VSLQIQVYWGVRGVMIPDTLDPSANFVGLANCCGLWALNYRSSADSVSQYDAFQGGQAPGWVQLVRQGNNFTAYLSSDGVSWTQFGDTLTVTMGSSVTIGLAVSAGYNTPSDSAIFDNVNLGNGPLSQNVDPFIRNGLNPQDSIRAQTSPPPVWLLSGS
jgi:hypothetical protein